MAQSVREVLLPPLPGVGDGLPRRAIHIRRINDMGLILVDERSKSSLLSLVHRLPDLLGARRRPLLKDLRLAEAVAGASVDVGEHGASEVALGCRA